MKSVYPFIVVEDVALQREYLIEMLQTRLDLELLSAFDNAEDAYRYIADEATTDPALIFLDIEMPEASGFNLLEAIRKLPQSPKVIVTTAFADYAVKGYEYDLSGYLLKPIEKGQLDKAITKALAGLQAAAAAPPPTAPPHLLIKEKGRWVKLTYQEILYVEGANVDVRIMTIGGQFLTRDRIKRMAEKLPSNQFLRIHDSFIINRSYVKTYASNFTYVELSPAPGEELQKLPIGPKYRDQFKAKMT